MVLWASGDSLTPSTLNRKFASAMSNTGFSTNTLAPESGSSISVSGSLLLGTAQGSRYVAVGSGITARFDVDTAAGQGEIGTQSNDTFALFTNDITRMVIPPSGGLTISNGTISGSGASVTNLRVGSTFSVGASDARFDGRVDLQSTVSLGLGAGTNVHIFGGVSGSGAGVVAIHNCSTTPSVNPIAGGVLFCRGGALLFFGASGSLTTIAPA